jgi:hypothetical protein
MTTIVQSTISLTHDSEFRVLRPEDAPLLRAFLLSLSGSQRRERFAGGISDHAINRHCDDLNWEYYFAFGWISHLVIRSLVELYPVGGSWETAEVTATTSRNCYRSSLASMLEYSLSEARRRGCRHLVIVEPSQDDVLASMPSHQHWMIRDGKLIFTTEDP